MTKTYNDIEAVTRLLEEKERDLELAARIGQSLLEKNKKLSTDNEELEEQLLEATEKVKQLRHEISMKDAIIQIYVQDYDGSPAPSTPKEPFSLDKGLVSMEMLQKKVASLEHENASLRLETSNLAGETDDLEEREQNLVDDAVEQLAEVNAHLQELRLEVSEKSEQSAHQQEEIVRLGEISTKLNTKNKTLEEENEELQGLLTIAQETQHKLSLELAEWNERHDEILALFHESSAEARDLRDSKNAGMPPGMPHYYTPSAIGSFHLPEGSLALELSDSLRKDEGLDDCSPRQRRSHNRRVMETARCVRQTSSRGTSLATSRCTSIAERSSIDDMSIGGDSMLSFSCDASDQESCVSERGYQCDTESMYSGRLHLRAQKLGRPGIPGSNDLETALRRLAQRKGSTCTTSPRDQDDQRNANVVPNVMMDGTVTPTGSDDLGLCSAGGGSRSSYQDSMMSCDSTSTSGLSSQLSAFPGLHFKMPERLQIVKPMEGSMTLHNWQRLATPHMGGLLDARPGIQNKGDDMQPEDQRKPKVYSIHDLEEDDDLSMHGVATRSTHLYTTATAAHHTETCESRRSSTGSIPAHVISSSIDSTPSSTTSSTSSGFSTHLRAVLRKRGLLMRHMIRRPSGPKVSPSLSVTSSRSIDSDDSKYTTPSPLVPLEGISDTAEPLVIGNTYQLVDKVKRLGVENMITTCAAELPAMAAGLNSMVGAERSPAKHSANSSVFSARAKSSYSGVSSRFELLNIAQQPPSKHKLRRSMSSDELCSPTKPQRHKTIPGSSLSRPASAASSERHALATSRSIPTPTDSSPHASDSYAVHTPTSSSDATSLGTQSDNAATGARDACKRAQRPTVLKLPLTVEAQLYSKPDCMSVFDTKPKDSTTQRVSAGSVSDSDSSSPHTSALVRQLGNLHVSSSHGGMAGAALMSAQAAPPGTTSRPSGSSKSNTTATKSSLAKLL